jgi:hypothetical protein
MGVAILGGMLSSTFLTLLVIPVVYTLFSDLARHTRRVFVRAPAQTPRSAPDANPIAHA